MKFSLIAAMDSKRGIGLKGRIPWRLPEDMKYFHDVTVGAGSNAVIMGRTTWESIPEKFKPLPLRINIVLTHDAAYKLQDGAERAKSLNEALKKAESRGAQEIFIIGGAKVYAEAVRHKKCAKIYLTEIDGDFKCDVFFPQIPAGFKKISQSDEKTGNGISCVFAVYVQS